MTCPVKFVGNIAHRDHPSFENRKELAGKALAAIHFDLTGGGDPELAAISEMVRQRSTRRANDNRLNLTTFLDDLHSKAVEAAAENPGRNPLVQAGLTAFKAHATSMNCARCTRNQPCSGNTVRDPALVAAGGLCLSIFTQMFTALIGLTNEAYQNIMSTVSPTQIHVTLKTEISRKAGAEVGGKTEFPSSDGRSTRAASVTATLPLGGFGQEHLTRLPYVLFHELFVHCPESWANEGSRPHTKETCGFREGFVDGAAASLLYRALNGGRVKLSDLPSLDGEFALETMAGHLARTSLDASRLSTATPGLVPVESLRRKGAKAFALFREAIGVDAELLAAALNVTSATDDERAAYLILLESMSQALAGGLENATRYMRNLVLDLRPLLSARPVDAEAVAKFFREAVPFEY
jgi:hypothetical protein